MVTKRHILFIVENSEGTTDQRVWPEAQAVKEFGYEVTVISPVRRTAISRTSKHEMIDGIEVYRHPMPIAADSKFAFLFEYLNALFWELLLSVRIFMKKPFHIIHSANPPAHVFLIAFYLNF